MERRCPIGIVEKARELATQVKPVELPDDLDFDKTWGPLTRISWIAHAYTDRDRSMSKMAELCPHSDSEYCGADDRECLRRGKRFTDSCWCHQVGPLAEAYSIVEDACRGAAVHALEEWDRKLAISCENQS